MPKLQDAIVATPSHPNTDMADWQTKPLGEVCSLIGRGISPKYLDDGGIRVLNQRCIRDHGIDWSASRRHNDKEKQVALDRLLQFGDGLINSTGTGTLGRVAQVVAPLLEPTTVDSHVTIVRPKASLFHPEFFRYMLIDIEDQLKDSGEGCGGQTELARSDVAEKFMVRFPSSIKEQQRIVTILDEAFNGIATAKTAGSKNRANAFELFESRVAEIFTARGDGWQQQKLDDVCQDITVGHVGSMSKEYQADGVPFLRSQNVRPFQISLENVVYINQVFNDSLKKSQLRPGDLAIVRTGYPGTAAVIPDDLPLSNCSDLVIVRPGPRLNPYYMAHFFNSTHGKRLVLGNIVGSAQKHFNIGSAKNVSVPIPSLSQQERVVSMLDEFRAETQRLEAVQSKRLQSLDALKQSLLHQAFSGNL